MATPRVDEHVTEIVRTSWRLRIAGTQGEDSLWWDGCTHDPKYRTKPHGWPTRERALARYTDYAATHLNTSTFRDLELVEAVVRETQTANGIMLPDRKAHLIAFANTLDGRHRSDYSDAMRESLKRKTVFRFVAEIDLPLDRSSMSGLHNGHDAIRDRMKQADIDIRRYFFHHKLIFCQEMADVLMVRCLFEKARCIEIPEDILDMPS